MIKEFIIHFGLGSFMTLAIGAPNILSGVRSEQIITICLAVAMGIALGTVTTVYGSSSIR